MSRWQNSVGQLKLSHQRLRELLERVGQNDDLHDRAQFIQKFLAAGQRLERADDFLDVRELDAVLVQDADAVAHQLVVIRLVARGAAQFRNPGLLGDGNPDFRRQHAFHVQSHNRLFHGARSFPESPNDVEPIRTGLRSRRGEGNTDELSAPEHKRLDQI